MSMGWWVRSSCNRNTRRTKSEPGANPDCGHFLATLQLSRRLLAVEIHGDFHDCHPFERNPPLSMEKPHVSLLHRHDPGDQIDQSVLTITILLVLALQSRPPLVALGLFPAVRGGSVQGGSLVG
ncbi:hypothetical protein BDN67DRAFT_580094 [Paxillus ammoniavirescens]|nr:hypothetical protein BDN67DRAFT_580094 [Paxillus ammoniavirescens]